MSNRWTIIGACMLLAVMVAACLISVMKLEVTTVAEKKRGPVRKQNLAEGIRVSRHGLYGVDLVSIGKAHMRKLRKGPFTIGAINELVLEDVSLALPEELWKEKKVERVEGVEKVKRVEKVEKGERGEKGPKAMLGKLGINAGNLKMGGKMPRFSALAIRNLRVSKIEGTNAVPWFAAAHGEAKRDGLALESGWSVEGGMTNGWKEALLVIEPKLELYHP